MALKPQNNCQKFPEIPVLILSTHQQKAFIENAIRIGVKGYILKNTNFENLNLAINKLMQGEQFFDNNAVSTNNNQLLSDQEIEIIKLIADGLSNKLIADKLFLSTRTIETYRAAIMKKLQVSNRVELIKLCLKSGVL